MTPYQLYQKLKEKYGSPAGQWKLWCKRPKTIADREQVVIEAILTQRTNWQNVEKAIKNLKKHDIKSLRSISRTPPNKLAPLIKPAGFYRTKTQYLINLAKFIIKKHGNLTKMKTEPLLKLREQLLKLKGVGPETADSILLYVLDKPIFVVDEYTRRLVQKYKLTDNFSYHHLQNFFQKNLKKDFALFQDFHALIVIDGKNK